MALTAKSRSRSSVKVGYKILLKEMKACTFILRKQLIMPLHTCGQIFHNYYTLVQCAKGIR